MALRNSRCSSMQFDAGCAGWAQQAAFSTEFVAFLVLGRDSPSSSLSVQFGAIR